MRIHATAITADDRIASLLTITLALGLLAFGGVAATSVAAASPVPVSECQAIDAPGAYVLDGDVDGSANQTCFPINASDVHFNGDGNTVTGGNAADSVGIYVNGSAAVPLTNVTVRNVTVVDWETGLVFEQASNGTIANVTATSNGDDSVHLQNVATVSVEGLTTTDNGGFNDAGLSIATSSDVAVTGHHSTEDYYGVSMLAGSGHAVTDSTYVEGGGVRVLDAQAVTVRDNDFEDSPAVDIQDSGGVLVANNTVVDGSLGRFIGTNGQPNHVRDNTIEESSRFATGADCGGLIVEGAVDDVVANNTWTECNSGVRIEDSTRIDFRNNTITGTDGGNSDYGVRLSRGSSHTIVDNEVTNNGRFPRRAGIFLGTHRATLAGNTLAGNGFNIELGYGNWSSLSHDIDATNTVEGRPVAYHVNETDAVVDPAAGWVALVGTTGAVVEDVDLAANNRADIDLRFATDTVVRDVNATPTWVAVQVIEESDRTRIEDSHFEGGRGITLTDVTDTVVANTSVTNSGGYGVFLSESPDSTFENVTVTGSNRRGIAVRSGEFGTERITVANSTVSNNDGDGIALYRASGSIIRDSEVRNNAGNGIQTQRFVHNVTIVNTAVTGNEDDGVSLDNEVRDTLVRNNTIADNGLNGIELGHDGANDTVSGNVVVGNAVGLAFPSTYDGSFVFDNHFNNSLNVGFDDPSGVTNATWNVSAHAEENVVGGPTTGGNYWATPAGDGFGETCGDADEDGLCDSPHTIASGHVDALPLVAPASAAPVVVTDPAGDLDGDGLYEDINGDGSFDIFDVQALFDNLDSAAVRDNPTLFAFQDGGSGPATVFDVQGLFFRLPA